MCTFQERMRSGSLETLVSCKPGDAGLISSCERFIYTPEDGSGCCLRNATETPPEGRPRRLALLPTRGSETPSSEPCAGRERHATRTGLAPSGPHRSLSLCGGAGRWRPACNFILAGDRLAVSVMRNLSLTQKPLVCIWINKDRYFVGDEAFVVAQAD